MSKTKPDTTARAAARLLRRARELLVTEGWTQGIDYGRHCLGFAIRRSVPVDLDPLRLWRRPEVAACNRAIVAFNDAPTTDLAAVLRVLDRAIANLETGRA